MEKRRTKIVATISDRRCEVDFIAALYKAGMNVVRINTAHVTVESAERVVENVRAVSDKIAILVDTKGPEIRITAMSDKCLDGIAVKKGDVLNVKGTADNTPSTPEMIYMNDASLFEDIPVGASLLIDDGEIELTVDSKDNGVLKCSVKNDGLIKSRKSVNAPGVKINLPSVTERDRMFIEWAIDKDIDFIAHSFVRSAADVMEVKKILNARNSPIKVISKIENREGIDNIDEILRETYGIMVARGDLGVEVPAEELPIIQKHLVKRCIESKSPVIIATQMLQSMITNPRPTRAEVSDIANAVYERTDAIMLSGETASGAYPVEAVETMSRVAYQIEQDNAHHSPFIDMNMVHINNEVTAQLARSTVRACMNLPIKAIMVDTSSGRTARYVSAFRGAQPVHAVCYSRSVMRQLALSFGVEPMFSEPFDGHKDLMKYVLGKLTEKGTVNDDDLIAVMGGDFGATVGASFLEIGLVGLLRRKVAPGQ